MGGYGSGPWHRSRYRLVERSCTLALSDLKRAGVLSAGNLSTSFWTWRWDHNVVATVRVLTAPSGSAEYSRPHLAISYQWREGEDGGWNHVAERFLLSQTSPPYGGSRWWMHCVCNRRVAKVYLPRGATRFRCRRCHQLRYRTQRMTIDARWQNRANRIVRRLGGEADDGNVYKPKWMRWTTFQRLMDDVQDWNNAAFGYQFRGLMKPESWLSRAVRRRQRKG